MSRPVLFIFAISHYCEKARWALEYHGLDHEARCVMPGLHRRLARRAGAPRSSLPILVADGRALQGSSALIDWSDSAAPVGATPLTPRDAREECRAIEERLDRIAGVHVRRYYYSEALVEHPHTVRPVFAGGLPLIQRLLLGAAWGQICTLMIRGLDLGREQGLESRRVVDEELTWLDDMLADGREFLVGGRFSRADLTAASLFAPLVLPEQHPTYATLCLPPRLASDVAQWEGRRSLAWVRAIYARFR